MGGGVFVSNGWGRMRLRVGNHIVGLRNIEGLTRRILVVGRVRTAETG